MEPRGDRLLALGFDNAATDGSLHVSLFDVADPRSRRCWRASISAATGPSFAEDQDRIHKAFTILDDLGTILVPYSRLGHRRGQGLRLVPRAASS